MKVFGVQGESVLKMKKKECDRLWMFLMIILTCSIWNLINIIVF
jgi:hypothetical protein